MKYSKLAVMSCERMLAVKLTIGVAVQILLFGCVHLPKADEPLPVEMNQCEPRLPVDSLEATSFTVSFSRMGIEQNIMVEKQQGIIRNRLLCSGLFKDVVSGKSLQGYYLDISILNDPFSPPHYGKYAWLSLATATAIPGYDEEKYHLIMNVYYNGIYRGRVETVRTMEIWYWFPFILAAPVQQETVRRQLYDSLLGDANVKLRQSGIIANAASLK